MKENKNNTMAEKNVSRTLKRGRHWFFLTEEEWMNSPFSIARHYGRIRVCGLVYVICDRQGRDIFECCAIANREGREYAIEPGEPADLVLQEFIPVYRKLGRDGVFKMLEGHLMTLEEAYSYAGIDRTITKKLGP